MSKDVEEMVTISKTSFLSITQKIKWICKETICMTEAYNLCGCVYHVNGQMAYCHFKSFRGKKGLGKLAIWWGK